MHRHPRTALLLAAAVLLAGAAGLGGAGSASAAVAPRIEGDFPSAAPGCSVVEEIELQGSPAHDWMRWFTNGDATGCTVYMLDNNGQIESQNDLAPGPHHSAWYYDGPGHSMQVMVYSPVTQTVYPGRLN